MDEATRKNELKEPDGSISKKQRYVRGRQERVDGYERKILDENNYTEERMEELQEAQISLCTSHCKENVSPEVFKMVAVSQVFYRISL